jgi:hypothetical protein
LEQDVKWWSHKPFKDWEAEQRALIEQRKQWRRLMKPHPLDFWDYALWVAVAALCVGVGIGLMQLVR